MIDELIYKDFDDISKNVGNLIPLYHCTTKEAVEGICKNGACREFTGKHSNFYGQGFYTTFELGSSMDNSNGIYGRYIMKFGLNGGFENFLFFDEEMNKKYNNGESIEDQISRLCPRDVVDKLINSSFFRKANDYDGIHRLTNKKLTAGGPREFFLTLKGDRLPSSNLTPYQIENGCVLYDELDISKTKVRGYIFVGGNDGEVCVVRDFNSLIPLKYFDPTIGVDPLNELDNGWIDILNKDTFNSLSKSIDVGTNIRGEYPETPLNTKTVCGFVLVKGKPKGKYNYVNVDTMEELLPVPADYAVDFDPHTEKAKFVIGGEEYEYSAKHKIFIEDGCFTYSRDEFAEELKDNGFLNESVKKTLSLIRRIDNL
jgi:hypothetical protein